VSAGGEKSVAKFAEEREYAGQEEDGRKRWLRTNRRKGRPRATGNGSKMIGKG
jgi:hypothetical protein